MFCARLFICAFWSPAGKGLTSWLSFVVSSVSLSLSHWYPGSGVVLDCIDSWSLHHYLLWLYPPCFFYLWLTRVLTHVNQASFLWNKGKQCRQDHTPQNVKSDQGLYCLLTEWFIEIWIKMKNTTKQHIKQKSTGPIDNNVKIMFNNESHKAYSSLYHKA